jgi:hypothetical protein
MLSWIVAILGITKRAGVAVRIATTSTSSRCMRMIPTLLLSMEIAGSRQLRPQCVIWRLRRQQGQILLFWERCVEARLFLSRVTVSSHDISRLFAAKSNNNSGKRLRRISNPGWLTLPEPNLCRLWSQAIRVILRSLPPKSCRHWPRTIPLGRRWPPTLSQTSSQPPPAPKMAILLRKERLLPHQRGIHPTPRDYRESLLRLPRDGRQKVAGLGVGGF